MGPSSASPTTTAISPSTAPASRPRAALPAPRSRARSGSNVDTLDVEGALKSERLNEADLAAGLYDNALVEIYRVNWADPAQRVLMRYGNLGEVSRGRYHFRAEMRGLAHELQQPKGRIVQFGCDADLGDGRCKVDLDQAGFRTNGGVVANLTGSPRLFGVTGLDAYDNGWFSRGLITWLSGANDGRMVEVKVHGKANGSVSIELWQRMSEAIALGDQFRIVAGCDKQFSTCKEKFDNVANFRGFPHVPGNDFMLSVASRQGKNDGKSRFK